MTIPDNRLFWLPTGATTEQVLNLVETTEHPTPVFAEEACRGQFDDGYTTHVAETARAGFILTTKTAWSINLSSLAVRLALKTGLLPAKWSVDADVALREAVANAILHGNLAVPGLTSLSRNLDEQDRIIGAGLENPQRGQKPVMVFWRSVSGVAIVHVLDDGDGFETALDGHSPISPGDEVISGRGHLIMKSCSRFQHWSRSGRTVSLGFPDAAP